MTEQTTAENLTFEDTAAALTEFVRTDLGDSYPGRRAAIELLVWHESWLRRAEFRTRCLRYYPSERVAVPDWEEMSTYASSSPRASTSELAVLRYAVALGTDAFDLGGLGAAHRTAFLQAMTTALGR